MNAIETALTTAATVTATLVILSRIIRGWFTHVIQGVVDRSIIDIMRRQAEFEDRQRDHLNRQDRKLEAIQSLLSKLGHVP